MQTNVAIPGIIKKISSELKILNLNPKIKPEDFQSQLVYRHRYFSPCIDKEKKTVGFYARCHNNLDSKEKFIREVRFLKKIQTVNTPLKKVIPKIIKWKKEKDFEWMIREYVDGVPLGHSRNLTTKIQEKTIKELAPIIASIHKIDLKSLTGLKMKKFNYENYLSEVLYLNLAKNGVIPEKTSEKIITMVKKAMPFLKKENKYTSQGDLNLGNIIIDKNNNPWIIDWELVHINNFAYDIGYFWAHLWSAERKVRNKIMFEYIKNLNKNELAKFKKLLPIVASYLSLGGVQIRHTREKKEVLIRRKKFYEKLLINCNKSFDELIKT